MATKNKWHLHTGNLSLVASVHMTQLSLLIGGTNNVAEGHSNTGA